MSFFGFQQSFNLEKDKQNFLEGGLRAEEDVAVYNSNEQDDYDGLGDALQERGDELNDETFGGSGPVGKDFDFSAQILPATDLPPSHSARVLSGSSGVHDGLQASFSAPSNLSQSSKAPDAAWDNHSPFSVLPRGSGSVDRLHDVSIRSLHSDPAVSSFSPFGDESGLRQGSQPQLPAAGSVQYAATGVHTLQEIEAEMRARSWAANPQARAEHLKPPRMRSQSPSILVHQQMQGRHSPAVMQQQLALQRLQLEQAQQQQLLEEQYINEQLLLEQQREQLAREQLLEKYRQEQHRLQREELERNLRNEQLMLQTRMEKSTAGRQMAQMAHRRQMSGLSESQQLRGIAGRTPDVALQNDIRLQQLHRQTPTYLQESPELVQALQMQQRYLAQMAQAEFAQTMSGISSESQELLRAEAMKKIMQHERLEEKRREKAAKIAHMSRYNDLMTQSDKDFITRIQVSQLFTSDPYTEDFYAQVYSSLLRSRMGLNQDERVLKLGSGEGVGLGVTPKTSGKRPNALQRMEAQVERIVQNARQREKEKGLHALHSLQGALGKTAGRSYKAAPRQLLQVDIDDNKGSASPTLSHAHAHGHISKNQKDDHNKGVAQEAAKLGREALGTVSGQLNGFVPQAPLTRRESLILLEGLYDTLLQVEQLRRSQVPTEDEEQYQEWNATYTSLVRELYNQTKILYPLESSVPHPFVSLLGPAKGKRLIPRLIRHLSQDQQLSFLTLLIATFDQLDVVRDAPLLDNWQDSPQKAEVEQQTQSFMSNVLQIIMQLVVKFPLAIINGLFGVLLEHCNVPAIAKTRPGLAVLTILLSRVEVIIQSLMAETPDSVDRPSEQEVRTWQHLYEYLFNVITPHLLTLFPSSRMPPPPANIPGDESIDTLDHPVWQFLAALALHGVNEQHSILVKTLREKVLDNLHNATKNWTLNDEERTAKITNVDLFLHALGLDSSQVAL